MTSNRDYGAEFVVPVTNGNEIRTDAYEDNEGGASYARVVGPGGAEIAYWECAEWAEDPQLVMGALLGAAVGGQSAQDREAGRPDFGMFTSAGDRRVGRIVAVIREVARLGMAEEPATDLLGHLMHLAEEDPAVNEMYPNLQEDGERTQAGHREIFDTAVREEIADALRESWMRAYGQSLGTDLT